MANMGYCRFQNTESDLDDCIDALNNRDISSDKEKASAKNMLSSFLEFCKDEGIIEDYNEDRIIDIIEECE